ncbi:MAG: TRAP transporter small permease [Synergistales bacterium]|nr:TRAP transporter small permease [Synergistales bacterium]
MLSRITALMHRSNNLLAELSGWLVTAIMVFLIFDIVSRLFSKPVQGVSEMAVFALVATVYLGLSHCEENRNHIRVEFFMEKMSPRTRKISDLSDYLIAVLFMAIASYASYMNALFSYQTGEAISGTTPLPVYPVKFIIFIGCAFYLLQLLVNGAQRVLEISAKSVSRSGGE